MELIFASTLLGPLVILVLRVIDMSLATVRMVLAVRDQRLACSVIGFVEILAWLVAAGAAFEYLTSPVHVLGYALGFSLGSAIGLTIEEKMALGFARMQVFAPEGAQDIATLLRSLGYGVTEFSGTGQSGEVGVLHVVAPRRKMRRALMEVHDLAPTAFVTVDEPKRISRGWMGRSKGRRF